MARNYTEQEREEAIGKIVRTSIDRLYGALGNRRTDVVFGQVQDAAAGVFITQPNAPYYVVDLANAILAEYVEEALNVLVDLEDTVRATDRRVSPVSSISSLANARGALGSLSSAAAARTTSLTRIQDVPAYKRFEQSTARFLADHGKNIRSGGNVVQTPEEARSRLAGLVSGIEEQYNDILRRVEILAGAIADYDALNLPAALSNSVIANSRDVISERFDQLDALNERDRLEILRDVVLDILTARAAVAGFGSLSPTVLFLYFTGQGGVFADEDHPAIAAALPADNYGPYVILDNTELNFLVDGTTAITVNLPGSYVAEVDSFIQEDYEVTVAETDTFVIRATGESDVTVALSPNATVSAQEIADDINTALGGAHPVEAAPYSPQLYLQGEPVQLTSIVGSECDMLRLAGDWSTLATEPALDDWVYIEDPDVPDNTAWYVVTALNLPTEIRLTHTTGVPLESLTGSAVADINQGGRAVRLTFRDSDREPSVDGEWSISLPVTDLDVSEDTKELYRNTLYNLGLVPDVSISSTKTPAQSIVDFVNDNPAIAPLGTARIQASREFNATFYTGTARTEPTDALLVVLATSYSGLTVAPLGGTSASFTGLDTAGVSVGDYIAIRTAVDNDVTNWGEITTVGVGSVEASMNVAVVAESDVVVEIGSDFSTGPFPSQLIVANDPVDPNDGTYEVVGVGGILGSGPPFELTLARPLILQTTLGYQPRELSVQYGQYRVVFSSTSTLLDSALEVLDTSSGGSILWGVLPSKDVGATVWFQLPSAATGVESYDMLEFKDTNAEAVSFSRTIENVEGNLLELTEPLFVDMSPYTTTQNAQAPSARIRKKRKDNYNIYQASLEQWLGLPASNARKYFGDLRKLLNPIIVNSNPTLSSVQAAVQQVQALTSHLTVLTAYLAAYEAPLIEQVDRIIETYQQQGADRAVDTLLEARFSDFFGLSQAQASYNGNLRLALREVNRDDLPLTKQGRNPGGTLLASYEEPNYEYDITDSEDTELPDPTQEVYEFSNSAF